MNDFYEQKYTEYMLKKIGCAPILLLCAVLLFAGCKTISESDFVAVHDTLYVHKVDTIKVYQQKTLFDTIHHWHTETITLSDTGDTIKQIVNNYFKERIIERDSSSFYRAVIDSLLKANVKEEKHVKVVEKKDFLNEWKYRLISLALLVAIVLLIVPYIKKWIKRATQMQ